MGRRTVPVIELPLHPASRHLIIQHRLLSGTEYWRTLGIRVNLSGEYDAGPRGRPAKGQALSPDPRAALCADPGHGKPPRSTTDASE